MGKEAAHIARATLELDLGQGPPRGALTAVNGRRWQFIGWIALASALEAWREGASQPISDPGDGAEIALSKDTDPQQVGATDAVGESGSATRGVGLK